MAKEEIPITQLKVGMFVTALDVSWIKTPFLKHSLLIENEAQIIAIQACGATIVTIDPDKGVVPASAPTTAQPAIARPAASASAKKPETTSLRQELDTAKQLRDSTRKMVQSVFSLARDGGVPRAEMISPFIDQTIDSLSRNSQALITLFLSKRPSSKLYNHAFNVMSMSLYIAQNIGYSIEDQRRIGLAALLMDIGWLKLPEKWFAFQTAYTDDEFASIKEHVDYSLQLLEKGDFDPEVYRIIAQHHERYDGSGYPAELRASQIHPMACILSLVDHFNSLSNGYYDKQPIIPARALQEVYKKATLSAHEHSLVQLLIRLVGVFPPSSAVLLNTGERGIITQVNWKAPLAPKVRILYNKAIMPLLRPFEVDLAKQENESVRREIRTVIDPSNPREDPANLLLNKE